MMTPISSTGPPIYSIGIPVEPVSSPIRAIVYTEEDLDEFSEHYWTKSRKMICGAGAAIIGSGILSLVWQIYCSDP